MKITIKGNKKDSYIITFEDRNYFHEVQIKHEEMLQLQKILNNKLK